MTHARTSIRNTFRSAVTGLTTTGTNVFGPEKQAFDDSELPCLRVFSSTEPIDDELGRETGALHRDLTIIIEGRAKMSGDIDALLDLIDEEVEVAIHTISTLPVDNMGSEKDFQDGLENPMGVITLTYRVEYFTRAGTPSSILFQ